MGRLPFSSLLSGAALVACNNKPSSPSPGASAEGPATPPAKTAAGASPAPVDEAAARAVFDAWLAAQNAGDFAAYEALYAPRFEGVRRSGAQTARLDRKRWMKEPPVSG